MKGATIRKTSMKRRTMNRNGVKCCMPSEAAVKLPPQTKQMTRRIASLSDAQLEESLHSFPASSTRYEVCLKEQQKRNASNARNKNTPAPSPNAPAVNRPGAPTVNSAAADALKTGTLPTFKIIGEKLESLSLGDYVEEDSQSFYQGKHKVHGYLYRWGGNRGRSTARSIANNRVFPSVWRRRRRG